jgi:hypothetical protein
VSLDIDLRECECYVIIKIHLPNLCRVKDNKKFKYGHQTRFWCSQDAAHKKKSNSSTDPNIKNHENPGMKRFPCRSKLSISCHEVNGGDGTMVIAV